MRQATLSRVAAALVAAALTAVTLGAPGALAAPLALEPNTCSTAQLSDVMAIYLTAPTPRATPMPIPAGTSSYLSKLLRSRLAACSRLLGAARAPACRPSGSEYDDPRLLWTQLRFCDGIVNPPAPPASPVIAWNLPGISGAQPVIFILGTGADPATVGKLVSTLSVYLNAGRDEAGYEFADDAVLVPEPGWTADTYATQCESSPNVEGAIVVNVTASGNGSSDEFISRRNWTAVEANALYAQCYHAAGIARGAPSYVWMSGIEQQQSARSTFTPLMPLAMLLTLGAMVEEFTPQRTSTRTSQYVITAPHPTPKPGNGYTSQLTSTNTSTYNSAQIGSVAGGFLSSAITYTNASAPLTPTSVDQQTWNALQQIAMKLIADMNCWQPAPEAIGPPRASDIIGPARSLPSYNPPPGLGAYSVGRPTAPFCAEPGASESVHLVLPSTPPPH